MIVGFAFTSSLALAVFLDLKSPFGLKDDRNHLAFRKRVLFGWV